MSLIKLAINTLRDHSVCMAGTCASRSFDNAIGHITIFRIASARLQGAHGSLSSNKSTVDNVVVIYCTSMSTDKDIHINVIPQERRTSSKIQLVSTAHGSDTREYNSTISLIHSSITVFPAPGDMSKKSKANDLVRGRSTNHTKESNAVYRSTSMQWPAG